MYTEYTLPPNEHEKYPKGLHKLAGPFDLALIKLNNGVTLIPGRMIPVGLISITRRSGSDVVHLLTF